MNYTSELERLHIISVLIWVEMKKYLFAFSFLPFEGVFSKHINFVILTSVQMRLLFLSFVHLYVIHTRAGDYTGIILEISIFNLSICHTHSSNNVQDYPVSPAVLLQTMNVNPYEEE